ncbi:hypothetical protein [Ornithinibacillus scapharcae]|uniref:hypothetical protein n=1 Tax=Ornithinibacillus scapharcae TaxID=1147159 RepID=UPI000225B3A9|nr:hypothetical protein [Ornithinibacillus scapharcae]
MEGLIEFLPILAFIVFGIIKAMSGENSNQKEKQSPNRPPVPRPATIPSQAPSGETQKPKQTVYQTTPENVYVEDQQKQQLEELASRLNTQTTITQIDDINQDDLSLGSAIKDEIKNHSTSKLNENQIKFRKEVKSGLNRKGLVQGVIMSEVLGQPRARKPYNTVISDRRKRNIR